jgi:hypothetical protein
MSFERRLKIIIAIMLFVLGKCGVRVSGHHHYDEG